MAQQTKNPRWVAQVKTDSTHPPAGLFKKNASTIARSLGSRKVSPKGPHSGIRMLNYFINRAGRGLSRSRRAELERAKSLLSKRIRSRASAKSESSWRHRNRAVSNAARHRHHARCARHGAIPPAQKRGRCRGAIDASPATDSTLPCDTSLSRQRAWCAHCFVLCPYKRARVVPDRQSIDRA